jgi:hypothetical protein
VYESHAETVAVLEEFGEKVKFKVTMLSHPAALVPTQVAVLVGLV